MKVVLTTVFVLCFFFLGCSGLMESTNSPMVASVLVPVRPTSDATPNKYTDVPSTWNDTCPEAICDKPC